MINITLKFIIYGRKWLDTTPSLVLHVSRVVEIWLTALLFRKGVDCTVSEQDKNLVEEEAVGLLVLVPRKWRNKVKAEAYRHGLTLQKLVMVSVEHYLSEHLEKMVVDAGEK